MVYVYINDNNNNFDSSETNQSINCFHSFIHLNKCIERRYRTFRNCSYTI